MSTLKKDVQTGRLLIIDLDNPPDITADEFMQYIHEGFVPICQQIKHMSIAEGPYAGTYNTEITCCFFDISINNAEHSVALVPGLEGVDTIVFDASRLSSESGSTEPGLPMAPGDDPVENP